MGSLIRLYEQRKARMTYLGSGSMIAWTVDSSDTILPVNVHLTVLKKARSSQLGIAFSGAVGIGLYQTSGQIIALAGPVGALIAYLFAGLTIFSVMRSLAEMASIRPVAGAIMDFPDVFVDEALGFAVGVLYW